MSLFEDWSVGEERIRGLYKNLREGTKKMKTTNDRILLPVARIYERRKQEGASYKELADEFSVSISTILRRINDFEQSLQELWWCYKNRNEINHKLLSANLQQIKYRYQAMKYLKIDPEEMYSQNEKTQTYPNPEDTVQLFDPYSNPCYEFNRQVEKEAIDDWKEQEIKKGGVHYLDSVPVSWKTVPFGYAKPTLWERIKRFFSRK